MVVFLLVVSSVSICSKQLPFSLCLEPLMQFLHRVHIFQGFCTFLLDNAMSITMTSQDVAHCLGTHFLAKRTLNKFLAVVYSHHFSVHIFLVYSTQQNFGFVRKKFLFSTTIPLSGTGNPSRFRILDPAMNGAAGNVVACQLQVLIKLFGFYPCCF